MTTDYFLGLSTIAQLKVFKGRAFTFFFFFSIHSSPTLMLVSSRREVHADQRNPRGILTSVRRQQRAKEDNLVQHRRKSIPSGVLFPYKPISSSFPISLLSHP